MKTGDFLLELGTEELPPKLLTALSTSLSKNLSTQLDGLKLSYGTIDKFATPRRLAVLVKDLQLQQNQQTFSRKGPLLTASDKAIDGFAKSCGIPRANLQKKTFNKGDYYYFSSTKEGLKTTDLLADIVNTAIKKIPITKVMRWGNSNVSFVRPVHWLVMLLGAEIVPASVMGLNAGNKTQGLRFTGEAVFKITEAKNYQKILLEKARIQVDFNARKETIRQQVLQVAKANNMTAVIDEALLDEVCALVECPKAFAGWFLPKFLTVPQEVLISAMKSHQKYFHTLDAKGCLSNGFIAVANIEPSDMSEIIRGNERVILPRLRDAEFFWKQDKSTTLVSRIDKLHDVLFMESLGSMADKSKRLETLAGSIGGDIGANTEHCARAALLCKGDLVSNMVGEFADLQGVMGGYYAQSDGENKAVATAVSEHYHPRFSHDSLPKTKAGLAVSMADKIDNIVGIYSIGHKPTGSKDPYALKRAALGLMRMMIEKKLPLNLANLIAQSVNLYGFKQNESNQIYDFIVERLETYYQEKNIDKLILKAVLAVEKNNPDTNINSVYDWHLRIMALNVFMQNENSNYLIEANKRIKNILKDTKVGRISVAEKAGLVKKSTQFDKDLYDATAKAYNVFQQNKYKNYQVIIEEFLQLKTVIDDFFDNVMINDDDLRIRKLRLNNISWVRQLFLSVADITYLSK